MTAALKRVTSMGAGSQGLGSQGTSGSRARFSDALPAMRWVDARFPLQGEPWPLQETRFVIGDMVRYEISREEVEEYTANKPWVVPAETIHFICDVHADVDAFVASLCASGGVRKTGPGPLEFELTADGRESLFVIGGDCLDKGPANLPMLDGLAHLRTLGARVKILAGNHDVRTLVGMAYAGRKEPLISHLFVRMGKKTIPLFKEVWDRYLADDPPTDLLSDDEVRDAYFPDESWWTEFPKLAADLVNPVKMKKELRRIREKCEDLGNKCAEIGMTLGMVIAALEKAREIFLKPGGDYYWFFHEMDLAYRAGSWLFIHAGVDDVMAELLKKGGVDALNARFRELMETDLFLLYHGSVGNAFRTKYREIDKPLTPLGIRDVHGSGIYGIVHGHRNVTRGQRIVIRNGMLNVECDTSMDANTRAVEGMSGKGGSVTVFRSDGKVLGISTDHPRVKVFDTAAVCDLTTFV